MKKIVLCSLVCLLFLPVVAFANPITNGFSTSGLSMTCSGGISCGTTTLAVTAPNPGWASVLPGSEWISYNAGTGAGPTTTAPNGAEFTVTETFNSGGGYLLLDVLADDTASVNVYQGTGTSGTDVFSYALAGAGGDPYSTCSNQIIGCLTSTEGVFDLNLTAGASYTLVITDEQVMGSSMGLDYALTAVPEPASMLLLGSGLLAIAKVVKKKLC